MQRSAITIQRVARGSSTRINTATTLLTKAMETKLKGLATLAGNTSKIPIKVMNVNHEELATILGKEPADIQSMTLSQIGEEAKTHLSNAASQIQKMARGLSSRKITTPAITLQKAIDNGLDALANLADNTSNIPIESMPINHQTLATMLKIEKKDIQTMTLKTIGERATQIQAAAITIQSKVRVMSALNEYKKIKEAAETIQKTLKMFKQKQSFQETRKNIIKIQSVVKMTIALKKYNKKKKVASFVAKFVKMDVQRKSYTEILTAIKTLQSILRGYSTRLKTAAIKDASLILLR